MFSLPTVRLESQHNESSGDLDYRINKLKATEFH